MPANHTPNPTSPEPHPPAAAQDAALLLAGFLLLLAWDRSGLDLVAVRAWGTAAGFAWRDHWLTSNVLHGGSRVVGWLVVAALAVGIWQPYGVLRRLTHRERIWWVGTTLLCSVLILALKRISATSCPWSLAEFGGTAHYVSHWARGVLDGGPGHCFPSGAASTAFAFLPGWFALRNRAPRAAAWWLAGVVIAGTMVGVVQMVRGAHYPSHTLWTAWLCWALSAISYHAVVRRAVAAPAAAPVSPPA
ncbi:MAG: phosphatase PAP2 family protein [Proteobacteria bacterium]|nr:phosphatase PAP2 family protein [Pseudomonadota bacterium]